MQFWEEETASGLVDGYGPGDQRMRSLGERNVSHSSARRIRLVALILVVLCCIAFVIQASRNARIERARKQDLLILASLYISSTNVNSIEALTTLLKAKGIQLNNSIPVDRSRPCYRLVQPGHTLETDPSIGVNQIAIEETNVSDRKKRFVATYDGSVHAMRLKH